MTKHTRSQKTKGKSALLRFFSRQVDRLYDAIAQSEIARFFCGYHKLQGWVEGSFFVGFIRQMTSALKKKLRKPPRREHISEKLDRDKVGIFVPSSLHKSLKTRLSEMVEESLFIEKAVSFFRMLLYIPLISYGVFIFAFGLSTTVIQALIFFLQGQASGAALDLFTGLSLVLLSLPVMFKGYEPLIDCLKKSVFGNLILHSMFGLDDSSSAQKSVNRANFLLFLAGVLCGTATLLLPPMQIVLLGVLLIVLIGVAFVPETGLLLLFACFPFLGALAHTSIVCGLAVLYVGVCWLIKVALGKRSFSFDLCDSLVLALMLIVFVSGFAGGQVSMQSALLYLAMIFGYVIVSNLLRSKLWIRRCSDGLILSSFAVAFIGLVQWMLDRPVYSVFGSHLILCCYLLSVIPPVLARLTAAEQRKDRFRYIVVLLVQTACIAAGGSRLAAAVWLIEVIGFSLLSSRKTLPILLVLALLCPIAACILPFFADQLPSLSYAISEGRREVAIELMKLIGDAPLTGIGMGDGLLIAALSESGVGLTPELSNTYLRLAVQIGLPGLILFLLLLLVWYVAGFSLICSAGGRREKCYTRGQIVGLTGLLFMGCFCYLWADYRLLMLFWALAGLYQAVRKYSIEHEYRKKDEAIPAENVQWVNLDLYFDAAGHPKGSEYHLAESEKGGNEK